mgnify:CR=1 FL=1
MGASIEASENDLNLSRPMTTGGSQMANEPTDDKIEKASADELRVMIKDFQNNSKVKD